VLPIITSQILAHAQMPIPPEAAAAAVGAHPGDRIVISGVTVAGPPPSTAAWPVRPSISSLAGGTTIWDFDVVNWQALAYDPAGALKAAIRLPIPPANVGASLDHPATLGTSWTLQTMLDADGRLWMEPFDTPKAAPTSRPAPNEVAPFHPAVARMWGLSPDGRLLGSIEIPGGVRVLELGEDFLLGLRQQATGEMALVTYRIHPPSL
jgi:hypothetical protein